MISPPTINLSRRPFRNNTTFYTVFAVCVVMLLLATIYNAKDFFARGEELSVLKQRLGDRSHRYTEIFQDVEAMKKEIAQVNLSVLSEKSAFANGLIVSHLFSWSLLFERLEELIPYDVKIRAIRPAISAQEIEIQLDGMSKSAIDLYEFESRLSDSEYFSNVYPLSENTRESRNEINFDLALSYIPAGKSGLDPSPPTPTSALPQSPAPEEGEAGEDKDDPAREGEAEGDLPEDKGAAPALPVATPNAVLPVTTVTTPQGPGPATGTPAPQQQSPKTPPAANPAAAGTDTPAPRKGPAQMTNKEFLDFIGEDRFVRFRGPLIPIEADEHGEATNAGLIRTLGLEGFLEARGELTMQQQRRP